MINIPLTFKEDQATCAKQFWLGAENTFWSKFCKSKNTPIIVLQPLKDSVCLKDWVPGKSQTKDCCSYNWAETAQNFATRQLHLFEKNAHLKSWGLVHYSDFRFEINWAHCGRKLSQVSNGNWRQNWRSLKFRHTTLDMHCPMVYT